MTKPSKSSKVRLKIVLFIILILVLALTVRLGYLQIYKSEDLKKGALEQWTKAISIKSKRGIIYDRKGKKLAISISASTIYAYPADIKDAHGTAKALAAVLDMDEELLYEKLTKKQMSEKIKQWVSREEANELRQLSLRGISVVDDNKRYYPYGNFATSILGFTNIDNIGIDGLEKSYESYLTGVAGKWVKTTDAANRQMPYDGEKIYDATDGLSIVGTIDETIQHFAEKAAEEGRVEHKAKNVSVIMMDPKTGDILAMTTKGDYDYDLNSPRIPIDDSTKAVWDKLPQEDLKKKWYEMWRNYAVSDIYEPGSTFKVVTLAAAIEENTSNPNAHFFCNGFIRDIKGEVLKCSRWYNPHGSLTLKQGFDVSCNVVFVNVARGLGKEKFYNYIKGFGFGAKTDIELSGEQKGIIPYSTDRIKEVNLATMSYGHGIAVTPIQMVNALSAIVNGGNLMKPRLVSELIDYEGNIVETFETEVIRKIISEQTSKTVLEMLETVVSEGSGTKAQIPGYRIGGKTGTAQKVVDGIYGQNKYIGSFIAVAPIDDPKIAMIVIVDEPTAGQHYGGAVAAPIAKSILEDTLNYLEIPPSFNAGDMEKVTPKVIVPETRNLKIGEVGKVLTSLGLKYTTEYLEITSDSTVIDQFPKPGVEVLKGSIIDLYLNIKPENTMIMPYLMDKTKDEVIKILDDMHLQYTLTGAGKAIKQDPNPGEEINSDMNINIEFSETDG